MYTENPSVVRYRSILVMPPLESKTSVNRGFGRKLHDHSAARPKNVAFTFGGELTSFLLGLLHLDVFLHGRQSALQVDVGGGTSATGQHLLRLWLLRRADLELVTLLHWLQHELPP